MVHISKNVCKNGIETIIDSFGVWQWNKKHAKKGLDHKNW